MKMVAGQLQRQPACAVASDDLCRHLPARAGPLGMYLQASKCQGQMFSATEHEHLLLQSLLHGMGTALFRLRSTGAAISASNEKEELNRSSLRIGGPHGPKVC